MKNLQLFMNNQKGSLTIEAAVLLPIIILMFFAFISLMHMTYLHGKVQVELNQLASDLMYDSYLLEDLSLVDLVQETYEGVGFEHLSPEEVSHLIEGDYKLELTDMDFRFSSPKDFFTEASKFVDNGLVIADLAASLMETARKEGLYFTGNMIGRLYFTQRLEEIEKRNGDKFDLSIEHLDLFVEEDMGTIIVSYPYELPVKLLGFDHVTLYNSSSLQVFSGQGEYKVKFEEDLENSQYGKGENKDQSKTVDEDGYALKVYVTDQGERYHINPACFHIHVNVIPVLYQNIGGLTPCEYCGDEPTDLSGYVYKTPNSHVYHTNIACSAIHHNIRCMTEKEALAEGKTPCGSCAK